MGRTLGFSQRPSATVSVELLIDISDNSKGWAQSSLRDTRVGLLEGGRVTSSEPRLDSQALPASWCPCALLCPVSCLCPCGVHVGVRVASVASVASASLPAPPSWSLSPGHLLLSFPRALCQVVLPGGRGLGPET